MVQGTLVESHDYFRRVGTAKRTQTFAPVVPSQDASRYQATDMPRPTYDLSRSNWPAPPLRAVILALADVATGSAIGFAQRIGTWLTQ